MRPAGPGPPGAAPPAVTYFVESREEALRRGYASRAAFLSAEVFDETTLSLLAATGGALAVAGRVAEAGLGDLLRRSAAQGVPCDLWLNLPREQGYWISLANLPATERAVAAALRWISREGLRVRRLGLDLEPPYPVAAALTARRPLRLARELLRARRTRAPQRRFERLLQETLRHTGLDLYTLPVAQDHAPLRRLLGLPRLPTWATQHPAVRVVRMLYSSLAPLAPGRFVTWQLRPNTVPALGIVSRDLHNPGITLPGPAGRLGAATLLTEAGLAHDLRQVVRAGGREVFVFALNGRGVVEAVERGLRVALRGGAT